MTGFGAVITGAEGYRLTPGEKAFFREVKPLGFILFARNIDTPDQVRALCHELREAAGHEAVITIDQEGGRVMRIKWGEYTPPPARDIGKIYAADKHRGIELARLNAYVIASELNEHGITANCAPVADILTDKTHGVIGDRAFGDNPQEVAKLSSAAISGFLTGGVWPVIKHIPGHGRATADSHNELPQVDSPLEELEQNDFVPFAMNAECPFMMTAHICYVALDKENCATQSSAILYDVIKERLGMKGLIVSDDINMNALQGSVKDRYLKTLEAGCDLVLYCSGNIEGKVKDNMFEELETLAGLASVEKQAYEKLKTLPHLVGYDYGHREQAIERIKELLNG